MKKTKLLLLFFFIQIFISFNLNAATITSTPGGGSWGDTLTWVGHVVPTSSDNVVIAGPVTFGHNPSMVDLEIISNGTLSNTNSAYRTISVNGDFDNSSILDDNIHFDVEGSITNSGTIACTMDVAGDVNNNGTWSASLILDGDILQTISGNFNSSITSENTFNQLSLGSPMELRGTFNLAGDTLDIGQNAITFRGGGRFIGGYYMDVVYIEGVNMLSYCDGVFSGAGNGGVNITGNIRMWKNSRIIGDAIVQDTLEFVSTSSSSPNKFVITGDLTNNGKILHGEGGYGYNLEVGGDIENNDEIILLTSNIIKLIAKGNLDNNETINVSRIDFYGATEQTISGVFQDGLYSYNEENKLRLVGGIELKNIFCLNGDTLDANQHPIVFKNTGRLNHGQFKNIAQLTGINMSSFCDGVFSGYANNAVNIAGNIRMWKNSKIIGDVVVEDTLEFVSTSSSSPNQFIITGDLTNNGKILHGEGGYGYNLEVGGDIENNDEIILLKSNTIKLIAKGNLDNNETINVSRIDFYGATEQTISGVFQDGLYSYNEENKLRLVGGIELKNIFCLNGDTLDANQHPIVFKNTGRLNHGQFKNIAQLTGINMSSFCDGVFSGYANNAVNIAGNIRMWKNSKIIGDVVVEDTLEFVSTSSSSPNQFIITGDLTNNGKILHGEGGYGYNLEVGGDIENNDEIILLTSNTIKLIAKGNLDNNETINVSRIDFYGATEQTISGVFQDGLYSYNEENKLRLVGGIELKNIFCLNGDTLDANQHPIVFKNTGRLNHGQFKNIAQLTGINMSSFCDGVFSGYANNAVNIAGNIRMWKNSKIIGDVVVEDTLEFVSTSSSSPNQFIITGDLTNNGKILHGEGGYGYNLEVGGDIENNDEIILLTSNTIKLIAKGNLDNNETINVSRIDFYGATEQTISGVFQDGLYSYNEENKLRVVGGIELKNIFCLNGDTLDANQHPIVFKNTGRLNHGQFKNIAQLTGINMSSFCDGVFSGYANNAVNITGNIRMWKNSKIIGDVVVEDTLEFVSTSSSSPNKFVITGDLINNGKILHGEGGDWYNLEVGAGLTNNGTILLPHNLFLEGNIDNNNHINVPRIELKGPNLQYLEGTFNDPIYSYKTSTQIALSGPLDIGKIFNFDGDTLDMAEYKLTLRDEGRFLYGHYKNPVIVEGINTTNYSNGHFYPPSGLSMILQGEVCLWKDVEILGNLYVQDTLSLVSTSSAGDNRFNIRGNLNNQGTMMHLEGNYSYDVEIEGNLINGGLGLIDFNEPLIVRGDLENSNIILVESVEIKGEGNAQNICLLNDSSIDSEVNFWTDNLPEGSGNLFWIKDQDDTIGYNDIYSFPFLNLEDDGGTYHALKNGIFSRNINVKDEGGLPVELIEFIVTYLEDQNILLSWKTASENNNNYFTIQRSGDGTVWEDIQEVPSQGNSIAIQNYYAEDQVNQGGTYYYKLIQTDLDGSKEAVAIASVEVPFDELAIFPNPPMGILNVEYSEPVELSLCDLNGRLIKVSSMNNQHQVNTSTLQSGIYMLYIRNVTGGIISTERIFIPK